MSVPFGGHQPAAPQPSTPAVAGAGPDLGFILGLVAAGLGLVIYACSFSDSALGIAGGLILPFLLGGGLLAGTVVLPKAPKMHVPATVLVALGVLTLLLAVVKGDTDAIVVVILIIGLLQLGACVVSLLMDNDMIKIQPKAPAYGQPGGWNPQSGSFPQQQPQQYGGQPQQQYGGQPQGGQQQPPFGGQPQFGGQQPGPQGGEGRPPQFGQQPYGQAPYGGGQQGGGGQGGGFSG